MRRAGRGVTEDSAADVHCRLLDRRRPPGLVRVRAGSGMSVITATQPSGTVDIRVTRGEPAQNVGDRETFSRTWIFVIIHDGGGGVRRNRRGSVVGSHDTVQRPVRVRCADCVRDVVLVRGRVLAGCRRRAQASGRRRRLGRARYRAMSVGGRPASGPPVSGTDPRLTSRPRSCARGRPGSPRGPSDRACGPALRAQAGPHRLPIRIHPAPVGSSESRLLDIMWIIGETGSWGSTPSAGRSPAVPVATHQYVTVTY